MSGLRLTARLPMSTVDTVARACHQALAQLLLIYRCGGSAGIVIILRWKKFTHRLPCFTLSTKVTEHLKQAAKVRGLGVERQLKPGHR